ncbi:unnamed protein product [Rotaria sp. Silwood1]|nr:unnamed protein product [Rotaria sp. Silwood1]
MIEESSTDNSLYKTYDILGKYLNSMGQHMEAVQAWEDGLRHLETSVERFDELGNEKIIDWINISLQTARLVHRLGTDGPGVSYKSNRVCYAPSKMTDAEQAEWKIEQFQSAVRHYKGVLEHIPEVKGAANALAEMKYENIFDVLERLLPQDVNPFFPMDIPKALGKLGDSRAIPLLIKIIENPMRQENDDSDSSDEIFSSGGKDRLVVESCLALASFINDEKAKEVLMNGINNEQTREACLAVLCLCTDEKQYFDELEKMLAQGDSLDYRVKEYLNNNDKKSHYVDQLLMLNEEIRTKTAAQKNDDDNE